MPEDLQLLERMRSDWNQRAREDAYFYVASSRRNQSTEEFRSSASVVIHLLEAEIVRLPSGDPASRRALEVGCGPGRLMIPLSRHFGEIHGVDVSDEMISLARELLADVSNARVHVNNGADLAMFEDGYFDFVYSCVVFQHIPSKQIILNYLHEIHRVLKTGGVLLCQFRGMASILSTPEPDTWSGCSFTGLEIAEFAAAHRFRVLAVSGEGTPYLWVTLRKAERGADSNLSGAALLAVTATNGTASIPQRGYQAAVSLWLGGQPSHCDLNDLTVSFNGVQARGCYLSEIAAGGGCQMNAILPRGIAPGPVRVQLIYRGIPIGDGQIEVAPAAARAPAVTSVTDGINLMAKSQVESGAFKAILQDIEDPSDVVFSLDGSPAQILGVECLDRIADQFCYTLMLPPATRSGTHLLATRASGFQLRPVEVVVRM